MSWNQGVRGLIFCSANSGWLTCTFVHPFAGFLQKPDSRGELLTMVFLPTCQFVLRSALFLRGIIPDRTIPVWDEKNRTGACHMKLSDLILRIWGNNILKRQSAMRDCHDLLSRNQTWDLHWTHEVQRPISQLNFSQHITPFWGPPEIWTWQTQQKPCFQHQQCVVCQFVLSVSYHILCRNKGQPSAYKELGKQLHWSKKKF